MATSSRKIKGAAGAFMNYLKETQGQGAFAYYDGFTRVLGKGAAELGIERGLTEAQWTDLFNGVWNGERLTRDRHVEAIDPATGETVKVSDRNCMVDITFSAPKGVSEAFARAETQKQADDIARIVFESACDTWTEVVEDFTRLARVKGERVTAKLIATPVMQYTARPVGDGIAQPHLHVHCPTFYVAKVGDEWYQLDMKAIMNTAGYRLDVFEGEVARRLEAAGYAMDYSDFAASRKGRITFEPEASNRNLRKHWSSAHEKLMELCREFEVENNRPPTYEQTEHMRRLSRGRKVDKAMDLNPDREVWQADAREAGFELPLVKPGEAVAPPENRVELLTERLMGAKGLAKEHATFNDDQIAPAIARCAVGLGMSREELHAFETTLREELVLARAANEPQHRLWTTQDVLDREQFIKRVESEMVETQRVAASPFILREVIARQDKQLDAEQQKAVEAACAGKGLVHVTGEAGAGKSLVAKTAAEVLLESKVVDKVVGCSVSAKTALEFGSKIGADRAGSVESILWQIDNGKLTLDERTVVFIDEAGLLDTHRYSDLLKAAEKSRVVLIGDSAQLAAIGAAGFYTESVERYGSAHLSQQFRFKGPQREADMATYRAIREGHGRTAVESLQARGRVHVGADVGEQLQAVMADYRALRDRGHAAADIRQVVETSNADVDLLNRFVQRDRVSRAEVSGAGVEVEDAEQNRRWTLHQNDQVLFLRSVSEHGQAPIPNGSTGTIAWIGNGHAGVELDDWRKVTVSLLASEHTQPIGLAYAQHVAKFQGGEVPYVQGLPSLATSTANSGYSQLTRGQYASHVYLDASQVDDDPLEALAERWSTRVEKRTASSYLAEPVDLPIRVDVRASQSPVTKPREAPEPDRAAAYRQRMTEAYEQSLVMARTLTPGL